MAERACALCALLSATLGIVSLEDVLMGAFRCYVPSRADRPKAALGNTAWGLGIAVVTLLEELKWRYLGEVAGCMARSRGRGGKKFGREFFSNPPNPSRHGVMPKPPLQGYPWKKKLAPPLGITSQRLLDQSQAGVYRGKRHIPPQFGPFGAFGATRVPYPKGLNCETEIPPILVETSIVTLKTILLAPSKPKEVG